MYKAGDIVYTKGEPALLTLKNFVGEWLGLKLDNDQSIAVKDDEIECIGGICKSCGKPYPDALPIDTECGHCYRARIDALDDLETLNMLRKVGV